MPQPLIEALDVAISRLIARMLPGDRRAAGVGAGTELAQLRAVRDRRRRAPHRPRRHRPHRPASRAHARARARAHDVDRARRLAVDGVRHRAAPEGRRRRRRRARVRSARRAPGGQRRAGRVRRRCARGCCRRVAPSRGWSRCGGCWPRASRPTASTTPRGWRARCDASARLARQPGLVVVISDFREQHGWERPLGSLRVRHSVLAVEIVDPREAELPAVGHLALVDPETGARIEVDTSRRPRAPAVRRARARASRGRGPRAPPPARSTTLRCRPKRTGCSRSGATCDDLRLATLAVGAVARPAGDRSRRSARAGGLALRGPLPGGVDAAARRRPLDSSWQRVLPAGVRARGDRGARVRAGAAARQLQRRRRRGLGDARHRPLRVDGRDGRRADQARRRRARRQHVHRPAPVERARRRGRVRELARRRAGAGHQPQLRAGDHQLQVANGATDTGDALELALQLLHGGDKKHPPSAIVLLSDGDANTGVERADRRAPGRPGEDPDLHRRARHAERRAAEPRRARAAGPGPARSRS